MQQMETPDNSLPPCPQFACIAEFDEDDPAPDCIVCGRLELTHDHSGKRGLTADEARAERLMMIRASCERHGPTSAVMRFP